MPRPNKPRSIGAEDAARRRIARERNRLHLSCAALAALMNDRGCPISASAIWKTERANRSIYVDEAIAYADVFRLSIRELLDPSHEEAQP